MQDVNVRFCRSLLQQVLRDVSHHMTIGTLGCCDAYSKAKAAIKTAWVWKVDKGHWEFHFGAYYWHGSADNAYNARANGWAAWLRKEGAEGYRREC